MRPRNFNGTWLRFFARSEDLSWTQSADGPALHPPRRGEFWLSQAAILLALGYLWICVINSLRYEWTTDPHYSYGWVVPVLCLGLLVRRWRGFGDGTSLRTDSRQTGRVGVYCVLMVVAALAGLYLPTRLIEGAVPEWRPIQWALGLEAV